MKYKAIIETDDYKDFEFFEDADGKYLAMKDKNAKYEEFIALHFTECQEPILDKIRADIEKTASRYTISRERDAMGQVEWSDRLIKESEVLEIIDKYKTESEEMDD